MVVSAPPSVAVVEEEPNLRDAETPAAASPIPHSHQLVLVVLEANAAAVAGESEDSEL